MIFHIYIGAIDNQRSKPWRHVLAARSAEPPPSLLEIAVNRLNMRTALKRKGDKGEKMIEAMLVVLSNPCPGRDDDFNDWYTNIHLRDALRFRGSIAAQRFKRSAIQVKVAGVEPDWQYLALYEAFNAALFTREHHDATLTPRMKISDAFDLSVLNDYYYFPLQFRENDPENPHSGGVILEQFNPVAGQEEIFRCWYRDEYFPQITARPGVRSGSFLMFRPHGQLLLTTPPHKYIAIYRIAEPSAAFAWQDNPVLSAASPMDPSTLRITCWDVLTQRVTEDDVHHTSAAALANEENARAHMGNRIITGGQFVDLARDAARHSSDLDASLNEEN